MSVDMVPFGHFEQELSIAGKNLDGPQRWTQTLNTREAVVTCRNDYKDGLTVETEVFTHLDYELVVVKKRISAKESKAGPVRLTFKYQLTPPGDENCIPWQMTCTVQPNETSRGADFRYQVDRHNSFEGIVSVFCDKPVTTAIDKQAVALSSDVTLDADKPLELTFFLFFQDSIDGKDYRERAAKLQSLVLRQRYDGLLASHRKAWATYWDKSFVHLPDERLERIYSFKLACHGNLVVEVAVKGGRLAKLTLLPGDSGADQQRTLVLRESLLDKTILDKTIVSSMTKENGQCRLAVRFRGPTDLVTASH